MNWLLWLVVIISWMFVVGPSTSQASAPPQAPEVVNVLPPALRALVALWDALYDCDQLSAATDK